MFFYTTVGGSSVHIFASSHLHTSSLSFSVLHIFSSSHLLSLSLSLALCHGLSPSFSFLSWGGWVVSSQSITLHPKVSKDWTPKKRISPKIQNPSKSLDILGSLMGCLSKTIVSPKTSRRKLQVWASSKTTL